ncbi:MAG: CvpA family protein [Ktedonobacteraceae bacterium]
MLGSLSTIDILFVATVILLVLNGFSNGAIASLVNLLSIPIAFVVAYLFGPRFTALLSANNLPATPLISYVVLFIGTVVILHILGTTVRSVILKIPLVGFGDRLAGGFIGFIEAWLLWAVLLFVLGTFLQDKSHLPVAISNAQFSSWQTFYLNATQHSLFAQVNSFIVPHINALRSSQ